MFKKLLATAVLAGATAQAAHAAPIGWYNLDLEWRDGTFAGRILYDDTSPFLVLQVSGTLDTTAQTTAITDVWNVSNTTPVSPGSPLNFTNWSDPSDPINYNASFFLELADQGSTLGVVITPDSPFGLYDWSAGFDVGFVDNSPLLRWQLSAVQADVPEPSTIASLLAGLGACMLARRRRVA